MPSVFQRHPRFGLFSGFVILCTFLLLASQHSLWLVTVHTLPQDSLQTRLTDAETIYQSILQRRQKLIQKYGPTPDRVYMFPTEPPYFPYTVWDYFPAAFNCPHTVQRIGTLGDGGKWICGIERLVMKPDCVIYSFGINHESSFESELLTRTPGCQVWGYDFSVTEFGPEVHYNSALRHRAHFHPYGLAGRNAHGPDDNPKMFTLQTLMSMNGHNHIDILKIDIESWEFETLRSFIGAHLESGQPLPFAQLQLEIHAWNMKFPELLQFWEMLEKAGLRPFWTEPNLVYQNYNRGAPAELSEYSFLNIHGENLFISDNKTFRPVHGPRD